MGVVPSPVALPVKKRPAWPLQFLLLRLGGSVVLLGLFQQCRPYTMEQRERKSADATQPLVDWVFGCCNGYCHSLIHTSSGRKTCHTAVHKIHKTWRHPHQQWQKDLPHRCPQVTWRHPHQQWQKDLPHRCPQEPQDLEASTPEKDLPHRCPQEPQRGIHTSSGRKTCHTEPQDLETSTPAVAERPGSHKTWRHPHQQCLPHRCPQEPQDLEASTPAVAERPQEPQDLEASTPVVAATPLSTRATRPGGIHTSSGILPHRCPPEPQDLEASTPAVADLPHRCPQEPHPHQQWQKDLPHRCPQEPQDLEASTPAVAERPATPLSTRATRPGGIHTSSGRKTCHTAVHKSHKTWRHPHQQWQKDLPHRCPQEPQDLEGTRPPHLVPLYLQQSAPELHINLIGVSLPSQHLLPTMSSKFPTAIFDCQMENLIFQHGQGQQRSSNLIDNKRGPSL